MNLKNCVVIIYDPSRTRTSGLALRAFRLTDSFMELYKEGNFDSYASSKLASSEVFEEKPIKARPASNK